MKIKRNLCQFDKEYESFEEKAYDFYANWDMLNKFWWLLGLTDFVEEKEEKKGGRGGAR